MAELLTDRQKLVLDTIREADLAQGRPPSIPELMHILGLASPNGVAKHLKALEAKGYIIRKKGSRGCVLTEAEAPVRDDAIDFNARLESRAAYIPLVGNVAAGSPILAQENIEDMIPVPKEMSDGDGVTFLLRVRGDSMIDEGILPGDLVFVRKCDRVANGDIAVVLVEDEATVKRFYQKGYTVVLEAANSKYEPIEVDLTRQACSIVGKVTGLIRSYKFGL